MAFLPSVRRLGRPEVEAIVQKAERRGRVLGVRLPPQDDGDLEPWTAPLSRRRQEAAIVGEVPATLELVHANQIYIAKDGLHPGLRNRLLRIATFQNPEFYKAQAMRLPTYDKPRIVACAEDHPQHVGMPRGCLDDIRQELTSLGVRAVIRDERQSGRLLGDLAFRGELRPEQMAAAEAMVAHDTGVLAATTASGKTVIAAWLIARRQVNTLVLVHRRQRLDQWVERLSTFLGLPAKSIGRIGGGRTSPTGLLDVALIQSLIKKGVVGDLVADYGHVIVDECHHLSAQTFESVMRQAKARFEGRRAGVRSLHPLPRGSDGRDAVRVAERHASRIDLVVSDVVMPYLGGGQLVERLAAVRPGRKVLFLSGYTDDAVVRHGVLEADYDFLQRPLLPRPPLPGRFATCLGQTR